MPELPDLTVYLEALQQRIVGERLERVQIVSPFVLRTAIPPIQASEQRRVTEVRRLGKRIVIAFEDELFVVLHLMIAGRLRWQKPHEKPPGRITLAVFEFAEGNLVVTEQGIREGVRQALLPLWNSYYFFALYANGNIGAR